MNNKFYKHNWHDSIITEITVDKSTPGKNDVLNMKVTWTDQATSLISFFDCYKIILDLNLGVIAPESILEAHCFSESKQMEYLRDVWRKVDVNLPSLKHYVFKTNSTNSQIDVICRSFTLDDLNDKK